VFQPGWRWSKDVAPIAGASSCQHRHVGYTISGSLQVRMEDGTKLVPWLTADDKEWILGRGVCEWLGWKLP
jgi:hypothetical protein